MKLIRKDENKKPDVVALCDIPAGFVFKFFDNETLMLRLGSDCGYCELGQAWESVEELDREKIENNVEQVKVYGKLSSITV